MEPDVKICYFHVKKKPTMFWPSWFISQLFICSVKVPVRMKKEVDSVRRRSLFCVCHGQQKDRLFGADLCGRW